MDLLSDLDRPAFDAAMRCLLLVGVAVAPGEWEALAAICRRAQPEGLARSDVEEALLQGVLFFGFPRIVTAFEVLEREWPADPSTAERVPTERGDDHQAGRELFARIYGTRDGAVRGMLARFHPEFHDFVLEAAYGRILSRPQLGIVARELIAVANLGALDQEPQLIAHARGAVAVGATRDQVTEAAWSGLRDDARVQAVMERV